MIFSASIGPLKSIVTVIRKFISFHQNDGTVQLRSFQSLAQIGYATQGNYFLRLTSSRTYVSVGTGWYQRNE